MAKFSNGAYRPYANYNITSGTSPVESPAFVHIGGVVRVVATEDIYIEIGRAPVATNQSMIVPAGEVSFFIAEPEDKVSVLQVSQPGIVSVTEID